MLTFDPGYQEYPSLGVDALNSTVTSGSQGEGSMLRFPYRRLRANLSIGDYTFMWILPGCRPTTEKSPSSYFFNPACQLTTTIIGTFTV